MNERDSEAVAAQLVAKGYCAREVGKQTPTWSFSNTCSVRDLAEQKAINKMKNIVGTARSEKREPDRRLHGLHGAEPGQGTH